MEINRRKTRQVMVGDVAVGGDAPVSIQSMTTTKTWNIKDTLKEIHDLENAGCQIIRVTVPDEASASALKKIKAEMSVPLVADIHFNYKMALLALEAGVDKIRINPGNIGKAENVKMVLDGCKAQGVPIRIGVNAGSLEKEIAEKYGYPTAEGMLESATKHIKICEENDFTDIIVSLKSSDVPLMMAAYRLFSEKYDYPLHLGVTESGTFRTGSIKSSVGIGSLLAEGIGDTIRVSLADESVKEVKVGKEILKSLGLASGGVTVIACPTCGRLEVDLFKIANEVEDRTEHIKTPMKVAIMGCAVNGPGESREADIGIACGTHEALLYRDGKTVGKIPEDQAIERLIQEIEEFSNSH
ncbi:MAG: flavodoxin-dependent (E)-4-hydroxy-3-methylbut-2-enyl-diphosphate synthase [Candidatus Marinimicrobia bacterium]|nr:flavodoxin-dependent (E)-4-hydroxy-3-methylbut-2-enyl-diphosphate synthase [Candidatus Neomarinimicrobiota bacterium]TFB09700.1 flavodoxin-dependent (E)-4-hydroxy-3-methylbut-2-enyl-diphosphate synthase [Candidatus Marinimicrobia bacterium MT.SAG.3]TFB13273.1 flavodoxin-dependent (E)-4-hydroxy-3-methylbut-2-enyl-diphosphate synthase [Candidatus Marinimicrobia bacterium MT.SAG.4]